MIKDMIDRVVKNTEDDEEDKIVRQMYETDKDIANYYDSIKNINKTIKYSFIVCRSDPLDTISVTKIVYWASFYKNYDDIIVLIDLIRGNRAQVNKLKEIFYTENGATVKDLLVKYYIDYVRKKEETKTCDRKVHMYLTDFYKAIADPDIYMIYDVYVKETESI